MFAISALIGSITGFVSQCVFSACFAYTQSNSRNSQHRGGGELEQVGYALLWSVCTMLILWEGFRVSQHIVSARNSKQQTLPSNVGVDNDVTTAEAIYGTFALAGIAAAWICMNGQVFANVLFLVFSVILIVIVMTLQEPQSVGPLSARSSGEISEVGDSIDLMDAKYGVLRAMIV